MGIRPSNKSQGRPVAAGERRVSARLRPGDVPWLKEVKPTGAREGRLIDISQSGVLIETTERLLPGRRSTLLMTDTDQPERVEAIVVRAQLVAIGRRGALTYRVGLTFAKPLPRHLSDAVERSVAAKFAGSKTDGETLGTSRASTATTPGVSSAPSTAPPAQDAPLHPDTLVSRATEPRELDGPFDSLWASAAGSELLAVAHVTETGCVAQTPTDGAVGDQWSVKIFLSAARHLTLKGSITSVAPNGQCLFTFDGLSAKDRRVLQMEIRDGRRGKVKPGAAPESDADWTETDLMIHLESSSVSLSANHW